MSKTARLYRDTRTAAAGGSNIDRLHDDLQDVTRIMTKNIEQLMWRGDSLDRTLPLWIFSAHYSSRALTVLSIGMSHLSTSLRSESEKYRKAARDINFQAMLRQYAPVAAVVFILLILLWWRFA
jgi:vesicle transport protein SEC22